MKVSEVALKELKTLLAEDYPDMELTEEKLIEIALNLLQTVKVIYGCTLSSDSDKKDG